MFVRRIESGWVVQAPAKINLALEVLGRRNDGYHEVETLLVPVRLFDTVSFRPLPAPLTLTLGGATLARSSVPTDRSNLAVAAIERLAAAHGRPATGHLTLWKRIPSQAGLGGGSSDAAAALVVANLAWRLNASQSQLMAIAAQLGSDVPFFLRSGPAVATGRGEKLKPVRLPAGLPLVVVQPPVGLATRDVFAALDRQAGEAPSASAGHCHRLVALLQRCSAAKFWGPLVRNGLQTAASRRTEWIDRVAGVMDRLPVLAHQMTGSGSGYFGICRTWRDARSIAARLREGPWQWVSATRTCL